MILVPDVPELVNCRNQAFTLVTVRLRVKRRCYIQQVQPPLLIGADVVLESAKLQFECLSRLGVVDMTTLKSFSFLLVFSLPLFAQVEHALTEHQLAAYTGSDDAVRSVMNYCDAADNFSQERQPRLFAQLKGDSTTESKIYRWWEFTSKAKWEAAGKPAPLAFVWDRDGELVRVMIVRNPARVWTPFGVDRQTEYCYGTDSKLIRIRAAWYVPTRCEYLFPCQLIEGHEFYIGQSPGITDWVFTADGAIRKLRNGKAVDDYFDPSYWLSVSDLHLRTSEDLPFGHSASQSTPK
jgi:hypothetical protein